MSLQTFQVFPLHVFCSYKWRFYFKDILAFTGASHSKNYPKSKPVSRIAAQPA